MGEPLVSVICTANIPSAILSAILTNTYDNDPDCEPALIFLSTISKSDWETYTLDSATQTPVTESFISPFVGMTVQQVAGCLRANASGTLLSETYFYIADERTATDQTLLLVEIEGEGIEGLRSVRVAGECANPDGVALTVGTIGFEEIESLVGDDGVYHG
ncbi:uncharacterized protein EURHEDRAFT_414042 [Aspergillus ruber CBS 135680]|uniref:DUF6924 domain-containing protein n=1 Tax=Aspergillus ruber (strain CBS 135680) TaxID=1388766 RepID=A0A017SAI0_ASPRC|nr:uncharacterized protein EURHEDRAFT_414042 [Aspergillus ruber CBS 135680]EYE93634.1 hypothetical protein EURHEDRAFT_414042 [Aspergillus ruber CBS 135680]